MYLGIQNSTLDIWFVLALSNFQRETPQPAAPSFSLPNAGYDSPKYHLCVLLPMPRSWSDPPRPVVFLFHNTLFLAGPHLIDSQPE